MRLSLKQGNDDDDDVDEEDDQSESNSKRHSPNWTVIILDVHKMCQEECCQATEPCLSALLGIRIALLTDFVLKVLKFNCFQDVMVHSQ